MTLRDIHKCRRCGKVKPKPRDNSTKLCVECEAETKCRHYTANGIDPKCDVGCDIVRMTAPIEGSALRSPCYFITGGQPVPCDKFQPVTIDECHADDVEWAAATSRMIKSLDVIQKIEQDHRGHEWSGTVVCPMCSASLHVSHSAYNGHVWGRCETKGCLSWMEWTRSPKRR